MVSRDDYAQVKHLFQLVYQIRKSYDVALHLIEEINGSSGKWPYGCGAARMPLIRC